MMSRRSDLAAATDELKGTATSSRKSRTPKFYKVAKKANSRSKEFVLKSLIMKHTNINFFCCCDRVLQLRALGGYRSVNHLLEGSLLLVC